MRRSAPAGLVIRSINEDADYRMRGDRTEAQVEAVLEGTRAARRPARQLCAWPVTCRRPPPPHLRFDDFAAEIAAASHTWGVEVHLVRAVIHAESAFNPRALSPKGAQGLMQLMPATAARFQVEDPFDPVQNIEGGVQYLAWLLDRFEGDVRLATAAYNAGEGAVDRYGGIPPFAETEAYVERVGDLAAAYRNAGALADAAASAAGAATPTTDSLRQLRDLAPRSRI